MLTSGHRLPNPYVIHCLGPVYGRDEPSDALLTTGYRRALLIAEREGLRSVAFPAISTGAFGFPMRPAAEIALRTVTEPAPTLQSVRRVRFVLYDQNALEIHARVLEEIASERC